MERLELAISGVERALRPAPSSPAVPTSGVTTRRPAATAEPSWLTAVRQQLPRVVEALGAERTDAGECSLTARATRLAVERNRLLRQLRQLAPALSDGYVAGGSDPEQLRRALLRLVHDISHHHQRVNDLVYDAGWRDVGGSE
jgi:hypothetical protein